MTDKNAYDVMRIEERVDISLRKLYSDWGYKQFRMGKFEEYDLYARIRDFIPREDIITLTGSDGKLLALRPDLTLSIVKNFREDMGNKEKVYYSENVYRADSDGDCLEFRQTGLECLGEIDGETVSEVMYLAAASLRTISSDYVLEISHIGFIQSIISGLEYRVKLRILEALGQKNEGALKSIFREEEVDDDIQRILLTIIRVSGSCEDIMPVFSSLSLKDEQLSYLGEVEDIVNSLESQGFGERVTVDFSIVNNMSYYSGILFRGYVKGISQGVLSGGRYDGLMDRMGKKGGAIGFAVYLDSLDQVEAEEPIQEDGISSGEEMLRVALPKGRLGQDVYDMFERAGYPCPEIKEDNRKLVFTDEKAGISYFWVKPSDVTVYVERGAADIGACGKDIILEYAPDVYELLDLGIGRCRMCVAGPKGDEWEEKTPIRVATKFPVIAKDYFAKESRAIDIIGLHGSIELAPILGLSDVIVDIVETGTTLRENDLEVKETVADISARIIANKASSKFKKEKIRKVMEKLAKEVER